MSRTWASLALIIAILILILNMAGCFRQKGSARNEAERIYLRLH